MSTTMNGKAYPHSSSAVLWSLYSFLRTPDDYWETTRTAVEVGDVDTTAAMAGAISGAHLGISAIPSRFSYHLTDRGTWGHIELAELAHKCYEIKTQSDR
jgi:ADP-ribosylglycohydrolase